MKKFKFVLIIVLLSLLLFQSKTLNTTSAEPDCNNPDSGSFDYCIQKLQSEIDALAPANENNKKELNGLNNQLADFKKRISALSLQLTKIAKQISSQEADLSYTQKIFEQKATSHYEYIRTYDPLLPFFSSNDATSAFREISLRARAADQDRILMEDYANKLLNLRSDKQTLEKNKQSLAIASDKVNERASFLTKEVAKADSYLASLSAKQNELAALKAGGFSTSVGDVPTSAEPCAGKPGSSNFCDPGFRPAFAGFSYGAPHRKGMSQYGAYGRAKSGQSAEAIIQAYYGGIQLRKDYPTNINITVQGYGTVDIETYVKRIYEMPGSWTANDSAALKAQAVAARSYALAYTNNGASSICATESCQVYKPTNKGGAWDAAVDATRGWVLVSGGKPFSAWYASTAGGFTFSYSSQGFSTPDLWDTPSGQGGWPNSAYEIVGGSPWFYKGWYEDRSGKSCGRNNPWLTSEEMADILNAWKVLYKGAGDVNRISPVGSCGGVNPYSIAELKSVGGFTSVSSVNPAVYGSNGSTVSVTFQTNSGTVTINGDELKRTFNLRAPGYIGIKSSLFNIEKL